MMSISCERIRPDPPPHTSLDSSLQIPVSTVTVPVQYEVAKLEKLVNTKIQGIFFKEKFKINDKGDSLSLEIEKNGPIMLSWNNPTLYYSFPVKVSGKFTKRVGNLKVRNNQPVEMEVVLHLATKLALNSNWQLQPQTTLEDVKWIKDPKLKILLLKVNLRKIVEEALEKNKDKLTAKLDETIPVLLDTRKVIQKLWLDIQKPIRINKKETQIWLKAEGVNITARFIDSDPERISLNVQLKAKIQTIIEGEVIPASNDTLPKYVRNKTEQDTLLMYILVKIPFSRAGEILNDQLRGKELKAEGYATTIRELELYGTDSTLALKVKLKGDVNGLIYLTAMPGYDTANSVLYAKKFAYDIDTENSLVNSANWLLKDEVLDMVRKKLNIAVQPYFDSLPNLITRGIEKGKVGKKIDLTFSSLEIKPINYLIGRDEFQILFRASGQAYIDLEQKLFTTRKKRGKKKVLR
jgi:hypothetical protein